MTTALHLKRTYLLKTETFVYSQLTHLRQARGVVLARDTANLDYFPGVAVQSFDAHAAGPPKRVSDVLYRVGRWMTAYERRHLVDLARQTPFDLFHGHYAVDTAYFLPLLRRFRQPLVVSCYGYDVSSFPRRYGGWGARYLRGVWQRADRVLAMSQDMRHDVLRLGCPPAKVVVHYHGINLTRFPAMDRDRGSGQPVRVAFVGSLGDERKGVEYLIQAFARLVAERPDLNVELHIVGEGRFRSRFDQLVQAAGIADRVTFAGFVAHDQLHLELAAADVFCHPSVTTANGDKEGIPGTIVEAMSTGLPVVTTHHAGIPEFVRDGVDGFVAAERDAAALAAAIAALAESPGARRRMGLAAAARAREAGDVVRKTADLERIYGEVLAARRTSADIHGSVGSSV